MENIMILRSKHKYALYCMLKREAISGLSYEPKSNVEDVIREPVIIKLDEEIYRINVIRETKQYQITGGKADIDTIKDSAKEMVQYIKHIIE